MLLAAALLAVASVVPGAAPEAPPAGTPVVILRDGTRYVLEKPYETRGSQARMTLTGGRLVSIAVSEIDVEASKRASAPPTPTPPSVAASAPTAKGTPRPTSKSITLYGSAGYSSSGPTDSYSAPAGSSSSSSSALKGGPVHVRGYTRSDGTYVAPHSRSAPSSNAKH